MSRHLSTETFQLDLRSSPSQQNLNPSRSSSFESQQDEMDPEQQSANERTHNNNKLDYYSIPVFLLELIVLFGLAYLAYFVHFQYHHEPLISGFYCDDIAYRHQFVESKLTKQFTDYDSELTVIGLLIALPIVLIIFCELVNSMFGALKFRKIRAICACCKLHSITRRSIRFSGAYLLGLLMLMISCDILATSTGRLRPYFAQDCPSAYQQCASASLARGGGGGDSSSSSSSQQLPPAASIISNPLGLESGSSTPPISDYSMLRPASQPISSPTGSQQQAAAAPPAAVASALAGLVADTIVGSSSSSPLVSANSRQLRQGANLLVLMERHWVDLTGQSMNVICRFPTDADQSTTYKFNQLAMSWPSFPAALLTYACLFSAAYLCFVGTARPFRIITCLLVMLLLLLAMAFNVQLVKEHYNHWDDVAAGAALSLLIVIFVITIYLNRFKDSHYYRNQKLPSQESYQLQQRLGELPRLDGLKGYSNEGVIGNLGNTSANATTQNGQVAAMRYFQIPRANYRGAPMRS